MELTVVGRLRRDVFRGQAHHLAVSKQDAFRFLDTAAQLRDVADGRSPDDRRGDRLILLGDVGVEAEDVRLGIEMEFLDGAEPRYSNRRSTGDDSDAEDGAPLTV